MWPRRTPIFCITLVAITVLATSRLLPADDTPVAPDGYKIVSVHSGDKVIHFRVKQQSDPLTHAAFPDDLDPRRVFSATNPMANKTFSLPSGTLPKSDSNFQNAGQNPSFTKPYALDPSSPSLANLNTKVVSNLPSTDAYSRNAAEFNKSYGASRSDVGQNQTAVFASTTSPDQNRTAVLGNPTADTFASPLADKTFRGAEADAAQRHLSRTKDGQILITDIPDRPLTIDEVRDLINHGFKPNTAASPPEPSKPLNDPNFQPTPMRLDPSPDTSSPASDDDKNDPVPPPGTMAAPPPPENSEPLPRP